MKYAIVVVAFVAHILFSGCGDGGMTRELERFSGTYANLSSSLHRVAECDIVPFKSDFPKIHKIVYYDSIVCGTCRWINCLNGTA